MTDTNSMEIRFVELMTRLFQLDEAERLDFGIYRIIRRHNHEVRGLLGEVTSEEGSKVLRGGELAKIIERAFTGANDEQTAEDRFRLKDLEKELGFSVGMTADAIGTKLSELEKIPATKGMVDEYRSRKERLAASNTAESDRMEVYNCLYQFYTPVHPLTGKPCSIPKSGWKFPHSNGDNILEKRSFLALQKDNRIAWGKTEKKVPQIKRMLHEVESNIAKSVLTDYSDGEKETSAMFGKSGVLLAPKHTQFVSRFIRQAT